MSRSMNWDKVNQKNHADRGERRRNLAPTAAGGATLNPAFGKFVKDGSQWLAGLPKESGITPEKGQVRRLKTKKGKVTLVYLRDRLYDSDEWEVWTFEK